MNDNENNKSILVRRLLRKREGFIIISNKKNKNSILVNSTLFEEFSSKLGLYAGSNFIVGKDFWINIVIGNFSYSDNKVEIGLEIDGEYYHKVRKNILLKRFPKHFMCDFYTFCKENFNIDI